MKPITGSTVARSVSRPPAAGIGKLRVPGTGAASPLAEGGGGPVRRRGSEEVVTVESPSLGYSQRAIRTTPDPETPA